MVQNGTSLSVFRSANRGPLSWRQEAPHCQKRLQNVPKQPSGTYFISKLMYSYYFQLKRFVVKLINDTMLKYKIITEAFNLSKLYISFLQELWFMSFIYIIYSISCNLKSLVEAYFSFICTSVERL